MVRFRHGTRSASVGAPPKAGRTAFSRLPPDTPSVRLRIGYRTLPRAGTANRIHNFLALASVSSPFLLLKMAHAVLPPIHIGRAESGPWGTAMERNMHSAF